MVDVTDIAPDAIGKDEADQKEHIWRIMAYGNPGTGKTHFGFSMPGPVCCIDTEGKAHSITHKFDKEIYVFEAQNYDEAKESLNQALDVLERYQEEEGVRGTMMVDSMANMWDWSQQKYMEMAYPGKSANEVNFQSALQGGNDSDWQSIKRLHNDRFRKPMIESSFNLYWTSTSKEDFGEILSGNKSAPKKPEGEKNNVYKATELIHMIEGSEGQPVANLKKNALTKWRFGRLEWPTFDKVEEIITTVSEAEADDESHTLGEILNMFPYDVELYEGDPDLVMSGQEE